MGADSDVYGESLDVRALARGLARSGRWILACVVFGVLAGLGAGLVRPNEYVSEGKIEVRLGLRESRTPESSLSPSGDTPVPVPGIGDEIALLYNPAVYERVARQIGPARLLAPYDPGATDGPDTPLPTRWLHELQARWFRRQAVVRSPEEELQDAAAVAQASIAVAPLSGTSYLWILSSASTPEMAQLLTRTYVNVARQWHREVYASGTELSFVSDQLKRYEEESAAAEQAFSLHRDQCGFYDLEEQRKSFVAAVAEHAALIQENTIRMFEIEDEFAFVEQQLATTPASIEKLIPPSATINPEYEAALAQIQNLTSERAALASIYTEASEIYERKAAQLTAEIERVESKLASTKQFIEYGAPVREQVKNPRHEELTIRRDELRQEKGTRARTIELWDRARQEQDQRLRAALQCEPVHRDLLLAETRGKARVQELSAALERAQALALLDRQEDMDSLRIALDGDLPRRKTGPDRLRLLMLGVFGGLVVGIFLATLRFLTDVRVHDAETLQKELGLELIGVVPEARAWRKASKRARGRARAGAAP